MKKRLSQFEQKKLLDEYYVKCIAYYRASNESTFREVVDAEHECNVNGIRSSEITKVRFSALNEVEKNA